MAGSAEDPGGAPERSGGEADARLGDVDSPVGGAAAAEFVSDLYGELRTLARSQLARLRPGVTLQPTALVHEAYLRLLGGAEGGRPRWNDGGHFLAAAARAMRNVLIDQARRKRRIKHGGGHQREDVDPDAVVLASDSTEEFEEDTLLALDEALSALEREVGPRPAEVVMLRYFAGLTILEVAAALGVTSRTVDRDWRFARAWLHERLARGPCHAPPLPPEP